MSTQQLSLDNFSGDPFLFQKILSDTGSCPNQRVALTCKALKAVNDQIIVRMAEYFINNVNRTLWNPPEFPNFGTKPTLVEARAILSTATDKVRTLRKRFFKDKSATDPFPDMSSATIASTPESFCTFLDAADFAELLRILQNDLPKEIQTWTRSDQIKAISTLSSLDLSENQLQALPKSFGGFINPTDLDLYDNQLQELPESFGNLENLEILDIRRNSPELARHAPSIAILLKLRQRGCQVRCDEGVERAIQKASQATEEPPAKRQERL